MDCYHFKTNAIERIWHRLSMDAKQEKKRAMDIWKQKLNFKGHQAKLVKRLVKSHENRLKEQALFEWKSWFTLLEHSCRVRCL